MRNQRKPTRPVSVGTVVIGGGRPVVVQSMCATKTSQVEQTAAQINALVEAGAGIVRVAVDNQHDVEALPHLRDRTGANLAVDLQENYRLAEQVASWVQKIRYNPGHLFHREPNRPWQEKVRYLADVAAENDCALRVGVNCGSIDPAKRQAFPPGDRLGPMVSSALEHAELLDRLGFTRFCVSLKDSNPWRVVEANRRFAAQRPDVPLHLGVTEAGMPPEAITKTRIAFERLLTEGIGDTIRVSLTVPNEQKVLEVRAGREILADVAAGRLQTLEMQPAQGLEIISCPSCSRVENTAFVQLAEQVRQVTRYAAGWPISIAVMGCRVNGPGETDVADLGLWCGPKYVNLKRGSQLIGRFAYHEVIDRLKAELDALIAKLSKSQT